MTEGTTTTAPPRQGVIPNPVPGGTFTDTFGACRGGAGCPRKHKGTDIFAPRGAPVEAPVAGKIVAAGDDGGLGGNRVWLAGNDGRFYYFAHLDKIAARVGDAVTVGTKLGTVGNTGDAAGGATHLHFSINNAVGAETGIINPFTVIDKAMGSSPSTPKIGRDYAGNPVNTTPPTSSTAGEGDYGNEPVTGCLIKFPGVAGIGSVCVLSRSQGRAVVGALVLAAGGVTMAAGVALIAVYGFQSNAARLALKTVGAPSAALDTRRQAKSSAAEAGELADVRASERQARAASAEARRAGAEERTSRVVERRSESANRSRSRQHARAGRTLPGEEAF